MAGVLSSAGVRAELVRSLRVDLVRPDGGDGAYATEALPQALAAVRRAPAAPVRLGVVYAEDPEAAIVAPGLRPVDAGANVLGSWAGVNEN